MPADNFEGSKAVAGSAVTTSPRASSSLSHAQAAAAGAANSRVAAETAGREQPQQGKTQAFLTAVPSPAVQSADGAGNPPVTPLNISATLAKLQDQGIRSRSSSFSGVPLSPVRYCPEGDHGLAAAARCERVAGGGGGGEQKDGASAEGASRARCHACHASSTGNPSSTDDVMAGFRGQQQQQQVDFASRSEEGEGGACSACRGGTYGFVEDGRSIGGLSTTEAAQEWAYWSRCHGGCQAAAAAAAASVCASASSEQHHGWHTGSFSSGVGSDGGGGGGEEGSFYCCCAPSSSVLEVGGMAFDESGGGEERFRGEGRGPAVGTMAAKGVNGLANASGGGNDLFNSLRHFVTLHVDPYKVGACL